MAEKMKINKKKIKMEELMELACLTGEICINFAGVPYRRTKCTFWQQ